MNQSRKMSMVEAVTNTVVGYLLAVGTQSIAFPLFGIEATFPEHLGIGMIFVVVSLVRSYLLRRAFAGAWRRPVAQRRPRWHDHTPSRPVAAPSRTSEVD